MPKPHPTRDKFLKYLRQQLCHDQPWVDVSGVYFPEEIREAMREVSKSDPLLHKILYYYVNTRNPRMRIAEAVHYDSSTVKRKLDDGVDLILGNMKSRRATDNATGNPIVELGGYVMNSTIPKVEKLSEVEKHSPQVESAHLDDGFYSSVVVP